MGIFDSVVCRARTGLVEKSGAGWKHDGRLSRHEDGGV